MADVLGMKVTVEGVENVQQMEFFQQYPCDEIQGYYFYKPMPADEMESVLRAWNASSEISAERLIPSSSTASEGSLTTGKTDI